MHLNPSTFFGGKKLLGKCFKLYIDENSKARGFTSPLVAKHNHCSKTLTLIHYEAKFFKGNQMQILQHVIPHLIL